MFAILPLLAAIAFGMAGCMLIAVARWWRARRRLERVFYEGRERRRHP